MFSVITNVYDKNTEGSTLTYLNGIVHNHRKTEKVFFLATRDVQSVHHG